MKEGRSQRDLCERTFQFALGIVNLCQMLLKKPGIGQTIGKQLLRSGTSIGAKLLMPLMAVYCEETEVSQSHGKFELRKVYTRELKSDYKMRCREQHNIAR